MIDTCACARACVCGQGSVAICGPNISLTYFIFSISNSVSTICRHLNRTNGKIQTMPEIISELDAEYNANK